MTNQRWILLICAFALLCSGATLLLHDAAAPAKTACIYSDGIKVMELELGNDAQYRITWKEHWNQIRVEDGKIRVAAASCQSQDCVNHGSANCGAPIVCLPNRLVITFSSDDGYDAIVG